MYPTKPNYDTQILQLLVKYKKTKMLDRKAILNLGESIIQQFQLLNLNLNEFYEQLNTNLEFMQELNKPVPSLLKIKTFIANQYMQFHRQSKPEYD